LNHFTVPVAINLSPESIILELNLGFGDIRGV